MVYKHSLQIWRGRISRTPSSKFNHCIFWITIWPSFPTHQLYVFISVSSISLKIHAKLSTTKDKAVLWSNGDLPWREYNKYVHLTLNAITFRPNWPCNFKSEMFQLSFLVLAEQKVCLSFPAFYLNLRQTLSETTWFIQLWVKTQSLLWQPQFVWTANSHVSLIVVFQK